MDWIINKKLALIVDNPLPLDGPVLHVKMWLSTELDPRSRPDSISETPSSDSHLDPGYERRESGIEKQELYQCWANDTDGGPVLNHNWANAGIHTQ